MICWESRVAFLGIMLLVRFADCCHGWRMGAVHHREGSPILGSPSSSLRFRNARDYWTTNTIFMFTRTSEWPTRLSMSRRPTDDEDDDNSDAPDSTQESILRTPRATAMSPSLQRHVQAMRESWPDQDESDGVSCTGEPPVDPSRQVLQENVENEEWW